MEYKEYYNLLNEFRLISPIWEYVLDMIKDEIKNKEREDDILNLFSMYFSLINDGNIAMQLDKNLLKEKMKNKFDATEILFVQKENFDKEKLNILRKKTEETIEESLDLINENNLPSLIGKDKVFECENNWLYAQKYNFSRKGIKESIKRLFSSCNNDKPKYKIEDLLRKDKSLSLGQAKAVEEGLNRNLIITGGPGTGKTTSILFLLINLLSKNKNATVYLAAPSGKASSRMKESIIGSFSSMVKEEFVEQNNELVSKIKALEESTIHRLLSLDLSGGFKYNKNHKFPNDTIFVIDEASMIDICLFNSLLEALPDNARLFIMGDKNQLPSVECGSVLAELLKMEDLKDYIVELDESKRFAKGTEIYDLASKINNGEPLQIEESAWKDYASFSIMPENDKKPIYYYKDSSKDVSEKDLIKSIIDKWGNEYYASLQSLATSLDPNDEGQIKALFSQTELSKVLCAENDGNRGVRTINKYIKTKFIVGKDESFSSHYPGELMMINKNNKLLDLYNGDSGILVSFKDDNTLYFMVQKTSSLVKEEKKEEDKIFKLYGFMFYPLRLISSDEIDLSYAITIHKSQGSDYKNILVVLPKDIGHPLLNRQIVYTAITRTKGNTYILSNQEILDKAKDTVLYRDTNIA